MSFSHQSAANYKDKPEKKRDLKYEEKKLEEIKVNTVLKSIGGKKFNPNFKRKVIPIQNKSDENKNDHKKEKEQTKDIQSHSWETFDVMKLEKLQKGIVSIFKFDCKNYEIIDGTKIKIDDYKANIGYYKDNLIDSANYRAVGFYADLKNNKNMFELAHKIFVNFLKNILPKVSEDYNYNDILLEWTVLKDHLMCLIYVNNGSAWNKFVAEAKKSGVETGLFITNKSDLKGSAKNAKIDTINFVYCCYNPYSLL